jgi:hypothetical protein
VYIISEEMPMNRRNESRGGGDTRRVYITPDPVPVAKKSFRTPVPETRIADIDFSKPEARTTAVRIPDIDFNKNTWSVRTAAAWAGIPERTLYKLLRAGALPCIAMGDLQEQKLARAVQASACESAIGLSSLPWLLCGLGRALTAAVALEILPHRGLERGTPRRETYGHEAAHRLVGIEAL